MANRGGWGRNALPIVGLAVLVGLPLIFGSRSSGKAPVAGRETVRLAYFPNVTHAPAVVGVARGEFEKALGSQANLDVKVFNAGPEEMEALLAGAIDIGYAGPSPSINTFLKSNGRALKILAGACSGGAALIARADTPITRIRDLNGKRIAVPQLGGTQDVSLRHFLAAEGLRPKDKGGTVEILPIQNPDILALFLKGQLDAAWVPEPWASRLLHDAHARLVVDERDLWPDRRFTTTVVVARRAFLAQHPDLVQAVLEANLRSIAWLRANPDAGQAAVNAELKRLTGKTLPPEVLQAAWGRVEFTADPNRDSIQAFVQAAADAGYLPSQGVNVADLIDAGPLDAAQHGIATTAR